MLLLINHYITGEPINPVILCFNQIVYVESPRKLFTYGPAYTGVSNPQPTGCMRPTMSMNVAQHKIINLLTTLWAFLFLLVSVHLMCVPRQLFIFQCGPEMPKCWTPLAQSFPRQECIFLKQSSGVCGKSWAETCLGKCTQTWGQENLVIEVCVPFK